MTHCLGSFWSVMRPLWASVTPEIPMPARTVRTRIHPRLRFIHPPISSPPARAVEIIVVSLFPNRHESKSLGGGGGIWSGGSGVNTRLGEGNNILGSPGQGEGNFEIGRILHLKS